jgi:uncharacterized protein
MLTKDKIKVSLGTATPGGAFTVYGAAVAQTINETDAGLQIEPCNTKGSAENIPMLEAGQLDMALVQGEAASEALYGVRRAPANLRIISAMYRTAGMFAVRADSAYRRIQDLVGKPVVFGTTSSGLAIFARYVLDGIGLDPVRDFHAIYLERAGDGAAMVQEVRAAAMWGAGIGWPGFETMARSESGARFIAPDAGEIERINAKYDFLKPLTVPAGSYPNQNEPIASVGSWSFILSRFTLPDELAYRIARALHEGEAALGQRLQLARETTAASTVAAAPRAQLLHPGVARYLGEQGLLR